MSWYISSVMFKNTLPHCFSYLGKGLAFQRSWHDNTQPRGMWKMKSVLRVKLGLKYSTRHWIRWELNWLLLENDHGVRNQIGVQLLDTAYIFPTKPRVESQTQNKSIFIGRMIVDDSQILFVRQVLMEITRSIKGWFTVSPCINLQLIHHSCVVTFVLLNFIWFVSNLF